MVSSPIARPGSVDGCHVCQVNHHRPFGNIEGHQGIIITIIIIIITWVIINIRILVIIIIIIIIIATYNPYNTLKCNNNREIDHHQGNVLFFC